MPQSVYDYYNKGNNTASGGGSGSGSNPGYITGGTSAAGQYYYDTTGKPTGVGSSVSGKNDGPDIPPGGPGPGSGNPGGGSEGGGGGENLAREKYNAQLELIRRYVEQQKLANRRQYESDRDQAEVNYYNGLRRMREQFGNTNGYNAAGNNATNSLAFTTARENTLTNLRTALENQNSTTDYNAAVMKANATNNLYDDNWNWIKWLQANGSNA